MAYKDRDKQREAVRLAVKRHRHRQDIVKQSITERGITEPKTIADVKALIPDQARAVLNSWAAGNGTSYQQGLGKLAQHYSQLRPPPYPF